MEFKIDTKETYSVIAPLSEHLDENMAAALRQKCISLVENGSQNFLIDMCNCISADNTSFSTLLSLHEYCYTNGYSLVFTNVTPAVLQSIKDKEIDELLNIAPTEIEAVDIISMEILERDLFNEE
ncbi:MAG: STAS domain-containing protein [Flavipsychrobacter sp.]